MGPTTPRRTNFKGRLYFLVMKKYFRLTLVCIAFTSFILMCVYQKKYSNLNLILQMMNAFGGKYSDDSNCSKKLHDLSKSIRSDWNTLETSAGLPMWTETFHNIHFYSAIWLNNEAKVLTFVDNVPALDVEKLKCQLLYENQTSEFRAVKLQLFQKNKTSLLLLISCRSLPGEMGHPYGVKFKHFNISSTTVLAIANKANYLGLFSMCIEPLPVGFTDTFRIIEYLVYHHHLGVNHFIFYDKGISYAVKKLLLELAPKSHIFVTLLPWNVPSELQSASKLGTEYFVDCALRISSRNYSSFIIHSNIDRFIVTKDTSNLTVLMSDRKFMSDPPRFYEEKFCLEYTDDIIARNLKIPFIILLKNKMLQNSDRIASAIYSVSALKDMVGSVDFKVLLLKGFPQKSTILPKHIAVLHSYKNCSEPVETLEKNFMQDKFLWKYKNLLFKSRLLNLAKTHSLVTLD